MIFAIFYFSLNFILLGSTNIFSTILLHEEQSDLEYDYSDGPYLIWNDNPSTSITIIWHTQNPTKSLVLFGDRLSNLELIDDNQYEKKHIIEIKELKANTTYYYRIPTISKEVYNFCTAPNYTTRFSFNVIGDTQNNGGNTQSKYSDLIQAMDSLNYQFILHTGDTCFSGNDYESWHYFFQNMVKHGSLHPYMISIGNHEYLNDPFANNFRNFFPYDYVSSHGCFYSFDYSNAHFIILDSFDKSHSITGIGDYISEAQLNWLKEELILNQDKWLIVLSHVPPLSTGSYNMNEKLIEQLCPIFYKYKVDVVINGHDHIYETFWLNKTENWGGTFYFVSGGGGGKLSTQIMNRKINPWLETYHNASDLPYQNDYITLNDQIYGELTHHFLNFEVDNDMLKIKAIRIDGTEIQSFIIKK